MTEPNLLEQCVAEMMHSELESQRLEVVLVPSPVEYWPTERQRRVVCERNPGWYRRLCARHQSGRRKPRRKKHGDTLIKRKHVLRALQEIAEGQLETEYSRRVYPFVQDKTREISERYGRTKYNKTGNHPINIEAAYPQYSDAP